MKTICIAIGFLLLSLLLLKNNVTAQTTFDTQRHREVINEGYKKKVYQEAKNNRNEIEFLFSGLFLFYKSFFSSQDQSVCTFTPSCSEFGIIAVKNFGVVKGGIMTMDRLTRCNGLSPTKYEIDKKAKLLKDNPTVDRTYEAVSIK